MSWPASSRAVDDRRRRRRGGERRAAAEGGTGADAAPAPQPGGPRARGGFPHAASAFR